jgi:hypothetical protein
MLELSDTDLIAELRAYTRADVMARDQDVRLTTRTSTCSSAPDADFATHSHGNTSARAIRRRRGAPSWTRRRPLRQPS